MNKGFTLLEMLVVLVIIGILAAVSVPQYKIAVLSVRYNRGRQIAEEIFRAEQAYYMAHGKITALLSNLGVSYPVQRAVYYGPGGAVSPEPKDIDELLGVLYELENGDELFINQSDMLLISYTPKGKGPDFRLYYVPEIPVVTRECGVTARNFDPVAYEEDAAVCLALGAKETKGVGEDEIYGSYFSWE